MPESPTREERMKEYGIYWCPQWCTQDPDEYDFEQHRADWREFTNSDGDTVRVRPLAGWWDNGDDQVEVEILAHDPEEILADNSQYGTGTIRLSIEDLDRMRELLDEAAKDVSYEDVKEAYDGAEADAEAAEASV